MLSKGVPFLLCLSTVASSFAMHYCAPSSDDLKKLGEMQDVIYIDESKQPVTAEEWMERCVMYQARAFMADSMGLPQCYDAMDACRCCRKAENLNSEFVRHYNHLDHVATVINRYFMGCERFKTFAMRALIDVSDEQNEFRMRTSSKLKGRQ